MNELTIAIRKHKWASWGFALFMGFVYWYLYARMKNGIWLHRKLDFITEMIKNLSQGETVAFVAAFNAFTELSSSIIPAVICALLLTHVFQNRAIFFSLGAVLTFLLFSARLWRYWFDPAIPTYLKIVGAATPIVDVLVLIFAIWLILKVKAYRARISPANSH